MKMLIDMNNLAVRTIFSGVIVHAEDEDKYPLWKFMIYDQIMKFWNRFPKTTEIILAVDDRDYWRKDIFTPYKSHRKKARDESPLDWNVYFQEYESFLNDIKSLPFKVIKCDRCEADDIIGHLALKSRENVVVVSTDKDYKQLMRKSHIQVYEPMGKKMMECDDPNAFLLGEIMMGQKKDFVFNILTPQNYSIDDRKPSFGEKKMEKILQEGVKKWLDKQEQWVKDRFTQNRILLDFTQIPFEITNLIDSVYNNYKLPEPDGFYSFFNKMNWRSVLENYDYVEKQLLRLYK